MRRLWAPSSVAVRGRQPVESLQSLVTSAVRSSSPGLPRTGGLFHPIDMSLGYIGPRLGRRHSRATKARLADSNVFTQQCFTQPC